MTTQAGTFTPWRRFPADPAQWFEAEELARSRAYHRPLRRVTIGHGALQLAGLLALVAAEVPAAVIDGLGLDAWPLQLLAVVALLSLYLTVTDLPVAAWQELSYDKRWEKSTTTPATFAADAAKGLLVNVVLFSALFLPVWAFIRATDLWWLWGWAVLVGIGLLFTFLAPVVLFPLFNKHRPLDAGPLRDRLFDVARQAEADIEEIEVSDASRRSKRENAYVAGLGATRKVVLWDTILDRTHDQIASVVAHEIGHWKLRHLRQKAPLGAVGQFATFAVLGAVMQAEPVLDVAGVSSLGHPAALPLFVVAFLLVSRVTGLLTAYLSRCHEREADLYALRLLDDGPTFVATMRALHADNLADLDPGLWKRLTHTHPPAAERMAMGQAWAERPDAPSASRTAGAPGSATASESPAGVADAPA